VALYDPIDEAGLRRELVRADRVWTDLQVVAQTGSTNADLVASAQRGALAGSVLIADYQSAGRGRLGRAWTAPPGSSIAMSALLRPAASPSRWTWLPLVVGLSVAEALRRTAGAWAVLKWPNDVLVGEQKLCGILAERVDTKDGPACVIGMGINVWLTAAELPVPTATSLAVLADTVPEIHVPARTELIVAVLDQLEQAYRRWESSADQSSLRATYLARCDTIGRTVRVVLADRELEGVAQSIDADGRLIVRTSSGTEAIGAGDVIHLRRV
jgi:BirA family transcriptional regulator, biotin operon repressor / biotin---[acetyl-CoA-carboxylase] ligase